MLFACEEAVKKGERRIQAPLKRLKVNYVPVDMLRSIDPMLLIFYNINTHEDLAEAQRLWTGHKL
jgi:molybdopterin-guanine dinucleotide biosynthesis protein A